MAESMVIWLNKRALRSLKVPLQDEVETLDDGWGLEFRTSAEIEVVFLDGNREVIKIEPGTSLAVRGDEVFLARADASPDEHDREETHAADERSPDSGAA
jgi:hypothetical protein